MRDQYEEFFSQARTAFVMGRYDAVPEFCHKALQLEPGSASVYTLEGNAYLVQERLMDAERCFRQALELDGQTGERYFDLGNSLFGQQRLSEALEQYAQAIQLGCRIEIQQKIHYLMGLINQQSGNPRDALINFNKSEQFPRENADQRDILLRRIQIYVEQQDFQNAENCAVQLNLLAPGEFQSYQLLFQIYLEQKKADRAWRVLGDAEMNCSLDAGSRTELGFDKAMLSCFFAQEFPDQAQKYYQDALSQLTELEKTVELQPKDKWESMITRAEICMKLNNYQQASQLAELAERQTDPALNEYIERGRYLLTQCAEHNGDYTVIQDYAQKLKDSANVFYRHYGYYAEAFAVGRMAMRDSSLRQRSAELYEYAIAYYRNSVIAFPGDFMAYLFRAKCYVDIGKYEKASDIGKLLPADAQVALQDYINTSKRS